MSIGAVDVSIEVSHSIGITRAGDEDAAREQLMETAYENWPSADGWKNHDASVVNLHVARTTYYRILQVASCQTSKGYYPAVAFDADRRMRRGERQVRCPACKCWKWPDKLCLLGKRELGRVCPEEDPEGYTRQQVRRLLADDEPVVIKEEELVAGCKEVDALHAAGHSWEEIGRMLQDDMDRMRRGHTAKTEVATDG